MKVILKKDIEKLGYKDDIVTVKNGYARNFLIPKKIGVLATESAQKVLAENLKQRAHKEAKVKNEAESLLSKIEGLSLKVGAKAGEKGKIFGSVNNIQLAEALKEAGFEIERRKIQLKEDTIKNLGEYEAVIDLHKEVKAILKFEVIGE
jgi:large subunit ribosomal protein L9